MEFKYRKLNKYLSMNNRDGEATVVFEFFGNLIIK